MDDNIWEYPFGDLEDDDEIFYSGFRNISTALCPPNPKELAIVVRTFTCRAWFGT
jgi:hypothetical protein